MDPVLPRCVRSWFLMLTTFNYRGYLLKTHVPHVELEEMDPSLNLVVGIILLDITTKVLEYINGWIPQPLYLLYTMLRSTWIIPTTQFPAVKFIVGSIVQSARVHNTANSSKNISLWI